MNKDKLLKTFRDTAIKCHIGFKHEGPWEECEWVECEDRRKMINEATPSAVNSYDALRAASVAAEAWIVVQAETWTCQHADQPMRCSRCSLRIKAKELVNQLRAALHPQPEETK